MAVGNSGVGDSFRHRGGVIGVNDHEHKIRQSAQLVLVGAEQARQGVLAIEIKLDPARLDRLKRHFQHRVGTVAYQGQIGVDDLGSEHHQVAVIGQFDFLPSGAKTQLIEQPQFGRFVQSGGDQIEHQLDLLDATALGVDSENDVVLGIDRDTSVARGQAGQHYLAIRYKGLLARILRDVGPALKRHHRQPGQYQRRDQTRRCQPGNPPVARVLPDGWYPRRALGRSTARPAVGAAVTGKFG